MTFHIVQNIYDLDNSPLCKTEQNLHFKLINRSVIPTNKK